MKWLLPVLLMLTGCATIPKEACRDYRGHVSDILNCPYLPECRVSTEDRQFLRSYARSCMQ